MHLSAVSTTIIICLLFCALVGYLVLERRTRDLEGVETYHAQTTIPCSALLLPTRCHALFRVPTNLCEGSGTLSLYATGSLKNHSNVLGTLLGLEPDPIKVFEFHPQDRFVVDTEIPFQLGRDHAGAVISLRLDTFHPGQHNTMSDVIGSVSLRYRAV